MPVHSLSRRSDLLAIFIVLVALALRLIEASQTYLNPDEALIFFISQPSGWYERSLLYHHPPLFFLLLHYLQLFSDSESFLRLLPAIAGSLYPWVIWKWLVRQQYPHAAWVAFAVLEFSPNLISLSAQVRGYTLVLLLVSLALYYLEDALEAKGLRSLLISTVCSYLAILTEYSAAFAIGALGVYALVRLVPEARQIRFALAWSLSQIGALAIYAALYKSSIATLLATPAKDDLVSGYLSTAFPQPSQDLFIFSIAGTVKQFVYLSSSLPLGYIGAALFAAGILFLCFAGNTGNQYRLRALAIAFGAAFVLALGAALLQLHPYGRSRQTAILTLFSAPGIAFGCEWLFRRFPVVSIPTAFLFAAACYLCATPDFSNIPKDRQQLPNMAQAIQQMKAQLPVDALILADDETTWMLHYYLGDRQQSTPRHYANGMQESRISTYRSFSFRWDHGSLEGIHRDLASLRMALQVSLEQPVWVLDGGFYMLPGTIPSSQMLSNTLLLLSPDTL